MALHYSDGSYVGGLPTSLGGLVGVGIFFGLGSSGLNWFLSLLIAYAISLGIMKLFSFLAEYTPKNYCEKIVGRWRCSSDPITSNDITFYSWEFRKDGTMIWYSYSGNKSFHYEIKRKTIVIDDEKKYIIEDLFEKMIITVIECDTKKCFQLKYS